VRQAAEALCALHEAGWLHADVKPANIHVSPSGHATLIDLGLALQLNSDECARGAPLRGTLIYTAPEMISSAVPVDGRSDTYSLGITLYELLAGQPPFMDDDPGRLMLAHMQREVPSLRRVLPGLNREVNDLVREMLAKEPLRRPAGQELVQRLVELELATLEQRCGPLAADPLRQDAGQLVDQ
jgi:serine/threonine-protein kinase